MGGVRIWWADCELTPEAVLQRQCRVSAFLTNLASFFLEAVAVRLQAEAYLRRNRFECVGHGESERLLLWFGGGWPSHREPIRIFLVRRVFGFKSICMPSKQERLIKFQRDQP
jgi:hypothetical protein